MEIHLYVRHSDDYKVFARFQHNSNEYRMPYDPETLLEYGETAEQVISNTLFQEQCQVIARKWEAQPELEAAAIKACPLDLGDGADAKPDVRIKITKLNQKRIEWEYAYLYADQDIWQSTGIDWHIEIYLEAVSLSSPDGLSDEGKDFLRDSSWSSSHPIDETRLAKVEELISSLPIEPHAEEEICAALHGGLRPSPTLVVTPIGSGHWSLLTSTPAA